MHIKESVYIAYCALVNVSLVVKTSFFKISLHSLVSPELFNDEQHENKLLSSDLDLITAVRTTYLTRYDLKNNFFHC